MARNEFFQIGEREHPAPADFGNDRASIFPDQVSKRLLRQPQRLSRSRVV
jgi:hypothetical protein